MKHFDADIVIVGAGLAGLSFAIGLANTPLRICLIDAKPDKPFDTTQSRPLSLNATSHRILKNLSLWKHVALQATPIESVHISEHGRFGTARLHAAETGESALGYVIDIADLANALRARTQTQNNLTILQPATVESVHCDSSVASLTLKQQNKIRTLTTSIVIAADGSQSHIVSQLGFTKIQKNYAQCAISATVSLSKPHNNIAYERFTQSGTIALLPMTKQRAGLVWTMPENQKDDMLHLSDDDFMARLQQLVGYRAGFFQALSARNTFPLHFSKVHERFKQRIIILGNAQQTIHPMAAQGFNLSLHDAMTLADLIVAHYQSNDTPIDALLCQQFEKQCAQHQQQIIQGTNMLVNLASSQTKLAKFARGFAINFISFCPTSRHLLSKFGMGTLTTLTKSARPVAESEKSG